MRILILTLSLLILSGCASIPAHQVDTRLEAWREGSIDDLVKFWGLPTRQIQLGENHLAEWVHQKDEDSNVSVSLGGGSWGRHTSIGIGVTLFNLGGGHEVCQRQVTYTKEGVILKIIWSGDTDYCHELTPDRAVILKKQKEVQEVDNTE